MGSDPASLLHLQPRSLAWVLTAEAYGAARVIPRPEVRELPPWQAHGPTQLGQTSLPPQLSLPGFPPLAWHQKQPRKRRSLLKKLGFLISGILIELLSKTYLKTLCLIAHAISFFCVLAGLFVIAKDLFLESPFEFPIWTPYPNSTIHIQRLELALLCFTVLEFFLLGSTMVTVCLDDCSSAEKDDLSLVPDTPVEFRRRPMSPPPSYEDVTLGGI
uniref:membrane-spanning 4-domains subfamily A member 10 isoform X5 n=1 Tax=Halichoerus grypus TaxID=9711 RepID=UPI001659B2BC|nr:membrane-spanning 4-domains subfamily A member 10 isoform X5 [Halichoerus grypus]